MNGLKPAVIHLDNIFPDIDRHAAIVIVDEDQQSLAIGKKGQNVRLASRLCGWDIDIMTREEFEAKTLGRNEEHSAPVSDESEAPEILESQPETEASTEG